MYTYIYIYIEILICTFTFVYICGRAASGGDPMLFATGAISNNNSTKYNINHNKYDNAASVGYQYNRY